MTNFRTTFINRKALFCFASRICDLKMLYQYTDYDTETLVDYLVDDNRFDRLELENRPTIEVWRELDAIQSEYGLAFDYVQADTFEDQTRGYFRYQLSFGGPSEEIRFFADLSYRLIKAEFWFLDWFLGQSIDCSNNDTVRAVWAAFTDSGAAMRVYNSTINHDL